MKLEIPGYDLNQRLDKGTICGRFDWKFRLQLTNAYCNKPTPWSRQKYSVSYETSTFKSCLFWFMLSILGGYICYASVNI